MLTDNIERHHSMDSVAIHIYPSLFKNDSRRLKITKSLADADIFDRIYILATWEAGLPETEVLDNTRKVIRLHRELGGKRSGTFWKTIKTLEWSWRIYRFLNHKAIDCITCHSLPVLPLGVLLKLKKHSKLIYDARELGTETEVSRGFRKYISKILERFLIRFVNETITVSDSIAKWYQCAYKLKKVWVVKNIPYFPRNVPVKTNVLRDKLGMRNDHILFIYQGSISKERGIDLLLEIFSKVHEDKHIVFMGFGELVELVKEYTKQYANIHYHPSVKPEEVMYYTMSADIGIHLIGNTCLNHYYCLPNKVFEYFLSGLPFIVSDFPEMGKLVNKNKCGWTVSVNARAVLDLINNISQEDIINKKKNALKYRINYGWHTEEEKLLRLYKSIKQDRKV